MDKLLQALLENEILTDETKSQLEEAMASKLSQAVTEAVAVAREEEETKIRAELTEKYIADKEALVEALDTKAQEYFENEIKELKEDIESFRDLEAEYGERLVEEKAKMAELVKADMNQLVEAVDTFLEVRLTSEMEELKESIDEVRKNQFGLKLFEQFEQSYLQNFSDEGQTISKLEESQAELSKITNQLNEANEELNKVQRSQKMEEVLADLSGRPRQVMEAILASVPTNRLEESYETFISRVLHESAEKKVEKLEKEETVLADEETTIEESAVKTEKTTKAKEAILEGAVVVSGNTPETVERDVDTSGEKSSLSESDKRTLRRQSGILG